MVVRKDIDNTSAVLTVSVPRETFKPKLDAELKKFRQKANLKGFRQGQAPMDFVKRMYGNNIFGEMLNELLSQELYDYLRDSGLQVLGQPLPTEDQANFNFKIDNPDPEYIVNYEVGYVPAFELKGLDRNEPYERLVVSNLDALAEDDLNYARKRMGSRTSPENDIQENDLVKIAAHEMEGDQPKADGWETTITILVKDVADEVLKARLLGHKKGDTIRLNPRLIENKDDEKHYRKYILSLEKDDHREVSDTFEGEIVDVSRVGEAELNEEFYKGYFGPGVTNREEAMDQIKKGIVQFYDVRSNALLMRSFQERLMAENPIELPDTFLKRWLFVNNNGNLPVEQIDREFPAFADNLRWSLLRD
ncbi:MAG: trigger factor, partial [Saprospiraceae bacterium]